MVSGFIFVMCCSTLILGTYILIRNQFLLSYRLAMIERIYEVNKEEIDSGSVGKNWTNWRITWFRQVGYAEMLYSFRSFDSFYPGKDVVLKLDTKGKNDAK